ncbi:hypothetical protein BDR22DRAFT_967978 [Usnea florida]
MPRPGQLPCATDAEERYMNAVSCCVTADKGTRYQISQRDIDATQQFSSHNERPFVSAGRATQQLLLQNVPRIDYSSRERAAMDRLSAALSNARCSFWHADLIIKSFFDLDILFFGGVLRGNVCFDWGDTDLINTIEQTSGEFLGITFPERPGRAEVVLNAKRILLGSDVLGIDVLNPLKTMFATALHEMCHAFEFVRVRPEDHEFPREPHGPHFGSRLRAVHENAKDLLGLVAVEDGEHFRCAPRYLA